MKRQPHVLTTAEIAAFHRLRPIEGAAFDFWGDVARARGLDPTTVLADANLEPYRFTALAFGHRKAWCWPAAVKCSHPPGAFA